MSQILLRSFGREVLLEEQSAAKVEQSLLRELMCPADEMS